MNTLKNDITRKSVRKGYVKKLSLPMRKRIKEMYNDGYSLRQIGDQFGVGATTILYHMKHVRLLDRVTTLEDKIEKIEYLLSKSLQSYTK